MPLTPLGGGTGDGGFLAAALARFGAAMGAFGGFEARPRLAVAVSGGADSMALLHLARAWCTGRDGEILALTVDHRLRPESASEAEAVGVWMARLGVPHRILVRPGPPPTSGIEAAARAARHALLEDACRAEGILHLLFAHHAGDQRETVAMRAERGPGPGASGMAALDWRRHCRLLRPLLGFEKADLVAIDRSLGQPWVEDPTNASDLYERNRMRKRLAASGAGAARDLDRDIAAAQAARAAEQRAQAARMQAWVRLSPLGYAWVDARVWDGSAIDLGVLARLLRHLGGRIHAPPHEALSRALNALAAGRGFTLGGCIARPAAGGFWLMQEGRRGASARSRGDAPRAVPASRFADGGETPPPASVPTKPIEGVCAPPPLGYDPGVAGFAPPLGITACAAWLAPFGADLMY